MHCDATHDAHDDDDVGDDGDGGGGGGDGVGVAHSCTRFPCYLGMKI